MLNKDLIDVAYSCVVNYFSKQKDPTVTLDFKTICSLTCKDAKISQEDFNEIIGSFYADLMQDGRFVFLGNDKWNLKDRITLEVYKKNLNSLYDYENTSTLAEEYDDEALPKDMKDDKDEIYEENEHEISRDSLEDDSEDVDDDDDENEVVRRTIAKKNRDDDDEDF